MSGLEEVSVEATTDVETFVTAAWDFLAADPVGHTVPLTSVDRLRAGGSFGTEPPGFAWVVERGAVVATASWTPPHLVALACDEPRWAAALAPHFLAANGVEAQPGVAQAFVAAAGRDASIHRHETHYRLDPDRLMPPSGVSGAARDTTRRDDHLVGDWYRAFAIEAGAQLQQDIAGHLEQRRRSGGVMWLWCDKEAPCCLAGMSQAVAGVRRVGPVYTPPGLRGNGYAAALTAALCRHAFAEGADAVTLFADAANATSNGVYRRLGFVGVADLVELVYDTAGAGSR